MDAMKRAEEFTDDQISAYMLWTDLWASLKTQCEASSSSLPARPSSSLTFQRTSRTEAMVRYRSGAEQYSLRVSYDADRLHLRCSADGQPFFNELFVKVRGMDAHFETGSRVPLNAEQAAASMLLALPLPSASA
jgi:hypothetical protein